MSNPQLEKMLFDARNRQHDFDANDRANGFHVPSDMGTVEVARTAQASLRAALLRIGTDPRTAAECIADAVVLLDALSGLNTETAQ